jgi:hypothetical protein
MLIVSYLLLITMPHVDCLMQSLISDVKQQGGLKQDQQSAGRLWKKKHTEARVKREYRTAVEVIRASGDVPAAALLSAQPILDMRGPQVRLVTNLEHLNVKVSCRGKQRLCLIGKDVLNLFTSSTYK